MPTPAKPAFMLAMPGAAMGGFGLSPPQIPVQSGLLPGPVMGIQNIVHEVPKTGPLHNKRYKTRLCKNWEATQSCPYFHKCQFAHGIEELMEWAEKRRRYSLDGVASPPRRSSYTGMGTMRLGGVMGLPRPADAPHGRSMLPLSTSLPTPSPFAGLPSPSGVASPPRRSSYTGMGTMRLGGVMGLPRPQTQTQTRVQARPQIQTQIRPSVSPSSRASAASMDAAAQGSPASASPSSALSMALSSMAHLDLNPAGSPASASGASPTRLNHNHSHDCNHDHDHSHNHGAPVPAGVSPTQLQLQLQHNHEHSLSLSHNHNHDHSHNVSPLPAPPATTPEEDRSAGQPDDDLFAFDYEDLFAAPPPPPPLPVYSRSSSPSRRQSMPCIGSTGDWDWDFPAGAPGTRPRGYSETADAKDCRPIDQLFSKTFEFKPLLERTGSVRVCRGGAAA